jgi:hypothetical protein
MMCVFYFSGSVLCKFFHFYGVPPSKEFETWIFHFSGGFFAICGTDAEMDGEIFPFSRPNLKKIFPKKFEVWRFFVGGEASPAIVMV